MNKYTYTNHYTLYTSVKKVFIYVFNKKSSCEKLRIDYFDYSCSLNIGEKTPSSFLVSIHLLVPILFPLVLISAYLYDICVHYLAACTHDPGFQSVQRAKPRFRLPTTREVR